ncbi:hypothetical protein [Staphylococcus capitis]|uniref:hypothetical protein n=1 Tax=Staphylococcus capitis TaxID=29388 RepID=UPI001642F92F|nr:hypothetical protein [Staphylococcus capitis]
MIEGVKGGVGRKEVNGGMGMMCARPTGGWWGSIRGVVLKLEKSDDLIEDEMIDLVFS